MGKQGPFSTIALWALAVLTFCYTLPTFTGVSNLPAWFTGMFDQQLSYGLDLQGGLELRYTVDWKKAISDNSPGTPRRAKVSTRSLCNWS